MTPAERVAGLLAIYDGPWFKGWEDAVGSRLLDYASELLAIAEAVPAALEGKTDALAAAWAALGDTDGQ